MESTIESARPTTAGRAPINHDLKLWPQYFPSLASGDRTAEVRQNDRDFRVGDVATFREWDPTTGEYTGHIPLQRVITFVVRGPLFAGNGLAAVSSEFAVLSLQPLPEQSQDRATMGTFTDRPAYDCLAKLKPGEPYFVLRGQDTLAPDLVREWASFAAADGCPQEKLDDANRIADAMEAWPHRKAPD